VWIIVVVALTVSLARADCPPSVPVDFARGCVGETTSGTTSFCFSPELGCVVPGVVGGIVVPDPPFALAALHVDGPLGTRVVTAADFPLVLGPGETLDADLTVVPPSPGVVTGRIGWLTTGQDGPEECDVQLRARPPACAPATACAGETCVAGMCVPVTIAGPCDDGDPCTTDDHCEAGTCRGTPRSCPPDPWDCTDEQCVGGACRSVPVDARCGSDECGVGACRPGDPDANARGCVTTPVSEGQACTDDGLACTDDVCTGGACLHVPVDDRCTTGDPCADVSCAPDRPDRDARGCATGPPPPVPQPQPAPSPPRVPSPPDDGGGDGGHGHKHGDGEGISATVATSCAEDGDPCTDDVCQDGRCEHTPVAAMSACVAVRAPFAKARGLAALGRDTMAGLETSATALAEEAAPGMAGMLRLGGATDDLDAAALALAGRIAAPISSIRPLALPATVAQERARIAFTHVLHTPQEVQSFLSLVNEARSRAALGAVAARAVRRRGRLLLRGTKTLKGQLKRLQGTLQTFAR